LFKKLSMTEAQCNICLDMRMNSPKKFTLPYGSPSALEPHISNHPDYKEVWDKLMKEQQIEKQQRPSMGSKMNEPRRRPQNTGFTDRRQNVPEEEVNRKYLIIQENSGNLVIGGEVYLNVKTDDIKILDTLGSGTCGTVHKVKCHNRPMAEKEMRRTDNREDAKRILMDLFVIRQSNECPFIVQCYGYIITEDYVKIYMELMTSCAEKLLFTRNNIGFPEEIIAKIALSVTKALKFLKEELSLMHRDIKPSNILLDIHGNVKLCDFGISGQLIDSNAASMSAGCISYLAPERAEAKPYTAQADVWSFGITLVHLAWGILPYLRNSDGMHLDPFQLMVEISSKPPPKLDPKEGYSLEFCDFVTKCLCFAPDKRPKFNQMLELPFLVNAATSPTDVSHWMMNQSMYNPPPGRRV